MELKLAKEDIDKLLEGKEFTFTLKFGALKLYNFKYDECAIRFCLDYPLSKNVACELGNLHIKEGALRGTCSVKSALANALAKIANQFLSEPKKGVKVYYPEISLDLSILHLPFKVNDIQCFKDRVEISGGL